MEKTSLGYDEASCFSRILMIWCLNFIKKSRKVETNEENVAEVPKALKFDEQFAFLCKNWKEELSKPNPSFLRAFVKTVGKEYLQIVLLACVFSTLNITQSVVANLLLVWLKDEDQETYIGVILLGAFSGIILTGYLCMNQALLRLMLLVSKSKSFVCLLLSQKVQRISYSTLLKDNNSAKVINIVGTDIELFELMVMTAPIWSLPLIFILGTILLWIYIGYAGLIAIAIIFVHVLLVLFIGRMNLKKRLSVAKITDSRVKLITNLIEGIKLVKLYSWELPFLEIVKNERMKECLAIMKLGIINIVLRCITFGITPLSIFIPMMIYIYDNGSISLESAISAFAIIFYCSFFSLYALTGGLRSILIFTATCKRITDALLMNEKSDQIYSDYSSPKLKLKDAAFSWSPQDHTSQDMLKDNAQTNAVLESISFSLKPGEILIVAGPVGCGKSSLLTALLREISLINGSYKSSGTFAYSSDTSWIISDTVKENILMGQEYDPDLYTHAIQASQLNQDIEEMDNGEDTIVGDRGITLSGGQKARIGLARAIYSNKDILLLDDPLSAVDSQVSSEIFASLLELAKLGKAIVLVTHQIHTLPSADKILILNEGKQFFCGKYEDLKEHQDILDLLGDLVENKPKKKGKEKEKDQNAQSPTMIRRKETVARNNIEETEKIASMIPGKLYPQYLRLGYKNALILILIVLLLIISQGSMVSTNFWISIWASSDDQQEMIYIYGFIIIIFSVYILNFIRYYITTKVLITANKHLHNKSVQSLALTDSVFFDKNPTGRILNRFTKDVAILDENLQYYITESINVSLLVLGNILIIIVLSPGSLVGVVVYSVFMYFIIKLILPISKTFRSLEIASRSPLLTSIASTIDGILTLRTMGVQKKFEQITKEAADRNCKALVAYNSLLRYLQFIAETGAIVIGIANVSYVVAMKGYMSTELAAVTLALSITMNGASSYWAKNIVETDNYMISPKRLLEYFELPVEGVFRVDNGFKINRGNIEFKDVYMKYQPHLPYSLKDLSFRIQATTKVGIIGRTGAGKSSILQVLFRMVEPQSGTVLIDGQDYSKAGLHDLRSQMSVIPQTSLIFRASLRDNLDPFKKHSDQQLTEVLNKVSLWEFFDKFPEKLDVVLSFDNVSLSTGQKQLVCLARAILSQNKIVLMDEATANVDQQTDKFIQKKIREEFENSTLLIIAHRLRTIIDSNVIIVMEDGTCKEMGRPSDLVEDKNSLFYNYIEHTGSEESAYLLRKIKNHHK